LCNAIIHGHNLTPVTNQFSTLADLVLLQGYFHGCLAEASAATQSPILHGRRACLDSLELPVGDEAGLDRASIGPCTGCAARRSSSTREISSDSRADSNGSVPARATTYLSAQLNCSRVRPAVDRSSCRLLPRISMQSSARWAAIAEAATGSGWP
jgi:hypothetical protein